MKINAFWFRRDLRLEDNAALYYALRSGNPVLCFFIFDSNIIDQLEDNDPRVVFIHHRILVLQNQLKQLGSDLIISYGNPIKIWQDHLNNYPIQSLYFNRDYESYAIARDLTVKSIFDTKKLAVHTFKDHIIFEAHEIKKPDDSAYQIFTPYKNKWIEKCMQNNNALPDSFYLSSYPTEKYSHNFYPIKNKKNIALVELKRFNNSNIAIPAITIPQSIIKNYDKQRDIPSIRGTSRLGIHFRFGTISIRQKARLASRLNATYLNEIIWRDFYSMILQNNPNVASQSYHTKYDRIVWRNDEREFQLWCSGMTGYPMVDAGMRELNATGFMHNRVRMITASFLVKHLLIDWRWGESYFASKLLDYDLASNNGGWQWAAGCGTDAAPYFRIFNPSEQQKKFDPAKKYIKQWIPEIDSSAYPSPMIEHKYARERCLAHYKKYLQE